MALIKRKTTSGLLRKKMARQTRSGWKQYLAIVLMGGIAMTLFVGLLSNAKSLSDRVESFYASGDMPDAWVLTSQHLEGDEADLRSVLSDGDQLDSRFYTVGKVQSVTSYCAVTPTIPTLSHPISYPAVSSEQKDDDFFLIDHGIWYQEGMTKDASLDLGQTATVSFDLSIYLNSFSDAIESLRTSGYITQKGEEFLKTGELSFQSKITGIMTYPENIQSATYYPSTFLLSKNRFRSGMEPLIDSWFTEEGASLVKEELGFNAAKESSRFPAPNEYLIKLKDSSKLDSVKKAIREEVFEPREILGCNYLSNLYDRSSHSWAVAVDSEVSEATQLTFVFPFVFFFVALLVILTTISQIILKERTQIGTMKAIGVSTAEIYRHYISLTLTLITIGSLAGFILGPLIVPFIMGQKYDLLYTLGAKSLFVFPTWQALLAYFVFALAGTLVTILMCHKEVHLSPAESMRAEPVQFKGKSRKRKVKKLAAMGLSIRMAFRNIRVSKVKSFMVVAGVAGCTALLICGFGIEDTLNYGIEKDLTMLYASDLFGAYGTAVTEEPLEILSYSDVQGVSQYGSFTSTASTASTSVSTSLKLFPDDTPYLNLDVPFGGVAVTTKVRDSLGLKIGDKIRYTYNSFTIESEVKMVFESFTANGIYVHYSEPEVQKAIETPIYTAFWIDAKDGADLNALEKALVDPETGVSYIASIRTQAEMRTQIADTLSAIFIMTSAVKVFAILLAIVVLYNLALMNFRERSRDIATMKVLGFTKLEIAFSLLFETMTLTAVGVLVGFALGYPFMYAVLYVNRVPLVEFLYHIEPITYLYSFLLTFVVALAVNAYLSSMTGRVKMVESLKSVE